MRTLFTVNLRVAVLGLLPETISKVHFWFSQCQRNCVLRAGGGAGAAERRRSCVYWLRRGRCAHTSADLASKVLHTMCVAFELNPIKDTYVKHLIWSRLFCL